MRLKTKTNRKPFDCVEMKHLAQEKLNRELQPLSFEERLLYYQNMEEALLARQKASQETETEGAVST